LEITIQHSEKDLAGLDVDSLHLYYLDEQTSQWQILPDSHYDKVNKVLTATTTHFTHFGEQANPLVSGPGRVMATQVDLHSGAATFSYPFELPPGPGGFQPKLEMTYNSGSVDEMKNKQAVGSWVGIGWTLNFGRITYDLDSTLYYLDFNGASFLLTTNDNTNYVTNPEQYFKITRNSNTWNLYDRDGNYYRFGGTTDSIQYITGGVYNRWDLSLIQDTNGNQAQISYIQSTIAGGIRSAYPQWIRYASGFIEVNFNSSYDRSDNPQDTYYNPAPKVMENARLNSISVKVNNALIRQYNFNYAVTSATSSSDYGGIYYAGQFTLSSLTQVGANGTSTLPVMTFSYQNLPTCRRTLEGDYTGNPGNPASFTWPHLVSINSGYGGTISLTYTQVPGTSFANVWTREVVTYKNVSSGNGINQSTTYSYAGNPYYAGFGWNQQYRGFNQVSEVDVLGNCIQHFFYTTGTINNEDADKLTGLEYDTRWYDSNATLLRERIYDWGLISESQVYAPINGWCNANDTRFPSGKIFGVDNQARMYSTVNTGGFSKLDAESNTYIATIRVISSVGGPGIASNNQGFLYSLGGNNCVQKFDSANNSYIWGSSGAGNGQFNNPSGICADNYGNIYVADTGNHRIQKFDADGNFILKWGANGTGDGYFNYPRGLAADAQGNVYVADCNNSRVQKFDSSGKFIHKWGSAGAGDGYFCNPCGVAVDSQGNVYVSDYGNHRVQKFDANGNFILKWGSSGSGSGQFTSAFGIAADGQGSVYVVDYSSTYPVVGRVQKFTSSGNFTAQWGTYGSANGQFYNPSGVAVDNQGYIYVSDSCRVQKFDASGKLIRVWGDPVGGQIFSPAGGTIDSQGYVYIVDPDPYHNCVQKFDAKGNFIFRIGSGGTGDGYFYSPIGVVVDSDGNIYVTDSSNYHVQKFDSSGIFVLKWGSYGTGDGQFYSPRGICIDSQNNIYVVDGGNYRIQKFDSSGNFIRKWGGYGTGNSQFVNPYWIAADNNNQIYVVDTYSGGTGDCVKKFDANGNYLTKWGCHGPANGQFDTAQGIAIDNQGYIYISD
jgi:streptogramin lyase